MKDNLPSPEIIKKIYYYLIKIRKFEEKIIELYPRQEMRCPVHLCIGQEAIAAAVGVNLNKEDYVFSNHRNHGHFIAKGMDIRVMFAEIYGRTTGCSGGKGGSMHLVDPERGIMGSSAIVAGGIPIAVGTALSSRMQKLKKVSVVFFGDGAVDQGTFYESMNFASVKKLPVVFVCENNFYATNSAQKTRQANTDIHKLADFFLMPRACIDGNNALEVYAAAKEFIGRARDGGGPAFIEARTYRCRTHVGPETDIEKGFRAKEEVDEWLTRCPYKTFRQDILRNDLLKETEVMEIENGVDKEIREALEFALAGPYPQKEDLYKDVY